MFTVNLVGLVSVVVVARKECNWCSVNSLHIFFKHGHPRHTLLLLYSVFSDLNTGVLINDLCEILTCRVAFSY